MKRLLVASLMASVLLSCTVRPYPKNSMVVVDIRSTIDGHRKALYEFEERIMRVFQTISSEKGDFQVTKGKAYQYYRSGNIYQVNMSTRQLRLAEFSPQRVTFSDRRDALEKELKRLSTDKKLRYGTDLLGSKLTTAVSMSNEEILKDLASVAGPQMSRSTRNLLKKVFDEHSTKAGIYIQVKVQKAGKKIVWAYKGWLPTYFFCPTTQEDQVTYMLKKVEDVLTENIPFLRLE